MERDDMHGAHAQYVDDARPFNLTIDSDGRNITGVTLTFRRSPLQAAAGKVTAEIADPHTKSSVHSECGWRFVIDDAGSGFI